MWGRNAVTRYLVMRYQALPPMKSGPAVAGELFDAETDNEAISFYRQKYTDRYDAQTGTVYLWKGTCFVWGHGLEATTIYSDSTSFPQNAGDSD